MLQTVPLGTQWPTLDPFLFCAHHLDDYPAGNGSLGPDAPLAGRSIGQDFAGLGGWNMYHGSTVPGFPHHPHRGFETITYVRSGYCDHSDSLGAKARFGEGDMQWLTSGAGVVHAEMFPLLETDSPNPLHLFQIWLNLPASKKMVEPYFSMYWNQDLAKSVETDTEGRATNVTVIAGAVSPDHRSPAPPPDSWAADEENDVQVWHIKMEPNASWTLPAGPTTSNRVLYFFEGDALDIDAVSIDANHGAVLRPDVAVDLAASDTGAECLVLQGKPIEEQVSQYGPFVMNTEAEIRQAMADYKATQFGGWPWPTTDPTHGHELQRFAQHPDGRVDQPS